MVLVTKKGPLLEEQRAREKYIISYYTVAYSSILLRRARHQPIVLHVKFIVYRITIE